MHSPKKIALAAAAIAVAASGVAAASTATVGAQHTSSAKVAPTTIPGTGVKKGQALPKGARLVYRDVTISGKQEPKFTISALSVPS